MVHQSQEGLATTLSETYDLEGYELDGSVNKIIQIKFCILILLQFKYDAVENIQE